MHVIKEFGFPEKRNCPAQREAPIAELKCYAGHQAMRIAVLRKASGMVGSTNADMVGGHSAAACLAPYQFEALWMI